ncbi:MULTISPECIES: YciI family protein [Aquitalea]|uniref:Uncharacterized protein YciI n=1 Tax=Aquitalea magnusonii TaxID=332411 RepID=A0A318J209_9NEIS|nr:MULTISPECIES: YciI family protein [Aquitalea]PXX41759.1 uncharacterized protein YciI [Aquitalea magnusonii]
MFIVALSYIAPLEEIDARLAQHVLWLKQCYADGLFLASGRKEPRTGGIILARGDRHALQQRLAQDPFALAGLARYDITEFHPSMTAPGLEALLAPAGEPAP